MGTAVLHGVQWFAKYLISKEVTAGKKGKY